MYKSVKASYISLQRLYTVAKTLYTSQQRLPTYSVHNCRKSLSCAPTKFAVRNAKIPDFVTSSPSRSDFSYLTREGQPQKRRRNGCGKVGSREEEEGDQGGAPWEKPSAPSNRSLDSTKENRSLIACERDGRWDGSIKYEEHSVGSGNQSYGFCDQVGEFDSDSAWETPFHELESVVVWFSEGCPQGGWLDL